MDGEEITIDKETKDILETDSVLMRKYVNANKDEIVLAIVYYKESRVALHLPESCLLGHGSRLTNREFEKIRLSNGEIFYSTKLTVKNDSGNNLVVYFFEAGGLKSRSYLSFRWQILLNKLKRNSSSGALVRFSINAGGDDLQNKLNILKDFISEIGVILPQYLI